MPGSQSEIEAVRRHLDGVLKSDGFAHNERLSRFLQFAVGRHLEGRDSELKESVIGVEVFGRQPGYDPRLDPVVRTEARRLRARLAAYYESAGPETVVIDVPKGGYVPVLRFVATVPAELDSVNAERFAFWRRKPGLLPALIASLAIALCVLAMVGRSRAVGARPQKSAAYDVYVRARAAEMRPACLGVEVSIELFEQAIAVDRAFAPAYAGLAAGEAARSGFDRFNPSERAEMIAKGWAAAEKAVRLDPGLPDAYDALGMMQARQAQWPQAERSFRHAIELAPLDPLWRYHFALFQLLPLRRIDDAVSQLRSAEEADPALFATHYALNLALRAVTRYADAEGHCLKSAEDDQQMSACWADTLLRQGRAGEAIRTVEAAWRGNLLRTGAETLGVTYARAGRRDDAERIAQAAPRPAAKAVIFAALADRDRTLAVLNQMVPMGPTRVGRDLIQPEYAFLRGDPDLKAIREKLGLPGEDAHP